VLSPCLMGFGMREAVHGRTTLFTGQRRSINGASVTPISWSSNWSELSVDDSSSGEVMLRIDYSIDSQQSRDVFAAFAKVAISRQWDGRALKMQGQYFVLQQAPGNEVATASRFGTLRLVRTSAQVIGSAESQGGIFSGISRPQNARRVNPTPAVARRGHCRKRCVRPATRRLPTCADRGVIRYVPRCGATRVVRFDSDVLNGDCRCFRSSADDVLPSACVKLLGMH
jgi:hypothetical protein